MQRTAFKQAFFSATHLTLPRGNGGLYHLFLPELRVAQVSDRKSCEGPKSKGCHRLAPVKETIEALDQGRREINGKALDKRTVQLLKDLTPYLTNLMTGNILQIEA